MKRESWSSKIGIILAVAGGAVGIGNYLRFPSIVAQNGGGVVLIPYFIALLLVGIPLAFMEWTMGRYAGAFHHGSTPGVFHVFCHHKWGKYLGAFGIITPLIIGFYYIYIESILLAYSYYSLIGTFNHLHTSIDLSQFFYSYTNLDATLFLNIPSSIFFFMLTLLLNFWILYKGIRGGIEKVSKIMMPLLFLMSFILFFKVLSLPNIQEGLAYVWNPDFSKLWNINVWFNAFGQVFFTIGIGFGAIFVYASYVKRNEDIVLSSLTSTAMNEFVEVIFGGTLILPLAILMLGVTQTNEIAASGTYNLSFITMPVLLDQLSFAQFFKCIWFLLLFFAGISSTIFMLQPSVTFMEDELSISKKNAVWYLAILCFFMGLLAVGGFNHSVVDEMDFWGSLLLIITSTISAIVFSWTLNSDKMWKELNKGTSVSTPLIFKYIMKYITPTLLCVLLILWFLDSGINKFTLANYSAEPISFFGFSISYKTFILLLRLSFIVIFIGINLLIFKAFQRKSTKDKDKLKIDDPL